MMWNPLLFYPMYNIPDTKFFRPPQLFDLLDSMVNFEREEQVKISELPRVASSMVFDFEYPLSTKVNKEDFETLILKKFFNRRIGYETYTTWKMQLEVKMNEIMPTYNKLFDSMYDWNLFKDGENYKRTINNTKKGNIETTTKTNVDDNSDIISKNSNLPQNEIEDIENGNYMTNYSHDTNTSKSKATGEGTNKTNENNDTIEYYEKDSNNKIEVYNKFLENRANIMSLIFKDLDSLFYGLSNYN